MPSKIQMQSSDAPEDNKDEATVRENIAPREPETEVFVGIGPDGNVLRTPNMTIAVFAQPRPENQIPEDEPIPEERE